MKTIQQHQTLIAIFGEHQILIAIFSAWYKQASQAEQTAFAEKFFNPSTQSDAIDDLIEWAGQQ